MPSAPTRTADTSTSRSRDPIANELAPVRSRRRPGLLALGALLAAIGALTVVWLVGAAGQRQEVLAVRTEVPYGQALTAADLTVARVSVDPGVAVAPVSDRDRFVGQVATTRLVPGMLLAPGMVEPAAEPGPGRVLVPVAVAAQRMPAGGLRAGDRILAVDVEAEPQGSGIDVSVVRVGTPDANGVTVVDVTAPASDGPPLAIAAAQGHVALVVRPSEG